ncbi:MAG: ABC transporter permease [Tannerellaceae bacterium]|nr:ABC transporter permease [Tannerellaceae bacterium]
MFDFDNFREIWSTVKKNKLRTFLTGFSVAWGILMLIILLGAGNGLRNGMMLNFRNYSLNRLEMWPRWTSMPYKGMQQNRRITFKNDEIDFLLRENPEIEMITGVNYHNFDITYGEEYNSYSVQGVHPTKALIDNVEMHAGKGRFINDVDIQEKRKVVVISPQMQETLFRQIDPVGKWVQIGKIPFQVIGVYHVENNTYDVPAYIPFSTSQALYRSGYGVDEVAFTMIGINTQQEYDAFAERLREQMGQRHWFDPADRRALGTWSTLEDFMMINKILWVITVFVGVIGVVTLAAGIVGVSNIMLITVRERTREFGIRKAIGATPISIIKLVVIESIIITMIFGYIGMVIGIGVTEGVNAIMEAANTGAGTRNDTMSIFTNPTVGLDIAFFAVALLVIAGVLAGYFPARKAVKVTAIEAMRHE